MPHHPARNTAISSAALVLALSGGALAEPQAAPATPRGIVRGVVAEIDPERGRMIIETVRGPADISAQPNQLEVLRTGAVVQVRYERFGGRAWMMDDLFRSLETAPAGDRTHQVATGRVIAVDREDGALTVESQGGDRAVLRAHPAVLEAIEAQQAIEQPYVHIGEARWVYPRWPSRAFE